MKQKSEDQLQSEFWKMIWNEYPILRRHIWAVPNAGRNRTPAECATLKATGMMSGIWDLHVFYKGKFYIIETKVKNNQLTTDRIDKGKKIFGQKEWGELMERHGAEAFVYRTIEEGIEIIEYILNK